MLDWSIEEEARREGYRICCGIDEAGRGPLAGPVFAAACILPSDFELDGLDDSKKLTEKKRELMFKRITERAVYAVASASVAEIEELNILAASQLAMRRALNGVCGEIRPNLALVDGNIARDFVLPARCVIGGDAKSPSIAAASILAKVSRDRLCIEYDCVYPQYGFAKNKCYGTAAHYKAVAEYGLCELHRPSFFKNYYQRHVSGNS